MTTRQRDVTARRFEISLHWIRRQNPIQERKQRSREGVQKQGEGDLRSKIVWKKNWKNWPGLRELSLQMACSSFFETITWWKFHEILLLISHLSCGKRAHWRWGPEPCALWLNSPSALMTIKSHLPMYQSLRLQPKRTRISLLEFYWSDAPFQRDWAHNWKFTLN